MERRLFKDAILDRLAAQANIAQFVSFGPALTQRFSHVHGFPPNATFASESAAIAALLAHAPERSVNVRSFDPASPESREFVYGLTTADEALAHVRRLAAQGLHTIVNETVDTNDGGVSGVLLGDVMEFAPQDTPRCVEKPGACSLPRDLGLSILTHVYGFAPALDYPREARVEFSLHPRRRGTRQQHTIIWQREDVGGRTPAAAMTWPNRFSRFLGDKAFGLLVADALGIPVPETLVIPRRLPPFRFGVPTGTGETWLRTCPTEPQPGHFTTSRHWVDPFLLLAREDEGGQAIASVLAQAGISARYSGAVIAEAGGEVRIEGVDGEGDAFMLGARAPEDLPVAVVGNVREVWQTLSNVFGPVRLEWVHDGKQAWVVQLHRGRSNALGNVIVPGGALRFHAFDVRRGLEDLRALAADVATRGEGVILVGDVGITSHFGDVLRRLNVPSRIERVTQNLRKA